MISESRDFWKCECRPRFWAILLGAEFWLSVAVSISTWYFCTHLSLDKIKVSSVISAVLNYAAIAFGFAVAGMALAISIPDRKLAIKMAKQKLGRSNAYSQLIFVFSWTALIHLWIIVISLITLTLVPEDKYILPLTPTHINRSALSFFMFFITYGVLQFYITIVTMSQVGDVYINQLKEEKDNPTS